MLSQELETVEVAAAALSISIPALVQQLKQVVMATMVARVETQVIAAAAAAAAATAWGQSEKIQLGVTVEQQELIP
jgi:hypothetical protein